MQNLEVIKNKSIPAYETSTEVKWYREKIIGMVNQIENEKFLNQIRIILKRHIERSFHARFKDN